MLDMKWHAGRCWPAWRREGVGVVAVRLIPVRVGDIEIEVEAVRVAGTEATSGRAAKAAGNVLEAFGRAQDVIIEVAKSTAEMIEQGGGGGAAGPGRGGVRAEVLRLRRR